MGTEIDHATSIEDLMNNSEDTRIAESGITSDVLDMEGGIARGQLEELGGKRDLLAGAGGGEVVGQDDVETSSRISQQQRQAGVPVARFAFVGIVFPVF
jgi:hypothetical protein